MVTGLADSLYTIVFGVGQDDGCGNLKTDVGPTLQSLLELQRRWIWQDVGSRGEQSLERVDL